MKYLTPLLFLVMACSCTKELPTKSMTQIPFPVLERTWESYDTYRIYDAEGNWTPYSFQLTPSNHIRVYEDRSPTNRGGYCSGPVKSYTETAMTVMWTEFWTGTETFKAFDAGDFILLRSDERDWYIEK